MPGQLDPMKPSRRSFLSFAATALAGAALGLPPLPAEAAAPVRHVSLRHLHTGEQLRKIVYFENGRYIEGQLRRINHVLRDWRTDEIKRIDPKLLDVLFALQRKLATSEPFAIVCGYRSPKTNAMLRRISRGVAKNSLHMRGEAIDLQLPDRSLRAVRNAAMQLRMGGVGYYPRSNFVHVDTGPTRYW